MNYWTLISILCNDAMMQHHLPKNEVSELYLLPPSIFSYKSADTMDQCYFIFPNVPIILLLKRPKRIKLHNDTHFPSASKYTLKLPCSQPLRQLNETSFKVHHHDHIILSVGTLFDISTILPLSVESNDAVSF